MSEPLVRDQVIELLNALGSAKDKDALWAARALHLTITQASTSWDDLLVADESEYNELEEKDQMLGEGMEELRIPEDGMEDDLDIANGKVESSDNSYVKALYSRLTSKQSENNELGEREELLAEELEDEDGIEDDTSKQSETSAHVNSVDDTKTLTLIDKLLTRKGNSHDLQEELEGYKLDITNGEFESSDHSYVKALYSRLMKRG